MRSMMGVTCSASERGWASLNHRVALNLKERTKTGAKECTQSAGEQRTRCACWFSVPLHLAGELDGPADVSAI